VMAKKRKWIRGAVKRRGALTAKAKRAGVLTRDGTISVTWLRQKAKESGTTGKQARLALTMRRLRKKRKRKKR